MIFLILLQIQVDSLYSEEKSFLFRGIQPPKEVIEIFDSIFYSVLNSMDTSKKDEGWGLFFHRFRHEIEKNKRLIDYAEQFYIEEGQWLPYYVPRIPISNIHKSIEILREWKRKHNRYLYNQRLSKFEDSLLKKRLEEYYKFKDGLSVWYEKIPEEMAVDEDFVELNKLSNGLYRGIPQWFSKVRGVWFVNALQKLTPEDSLFVGYFSLLQSHTDTTGSFFFLKRDSLKQITTDSLHNIYRYPIDENSWVVEFKYDKEKNCWKTNPIFVPFCFNPFANGDKDPEFLLFISKSLSEIEEISTIESNGRVGSYYIIDNKFSWWVTDRFSAHGFEKIKVKFYYVPSPIENFPSPYYFFDRKTEDPRVSEVDSGVCYYRLPWVDKPEIMLVAGISFLVKPTRNPIYRTIHTIIVTGLTLRNIGLKIGGYFRHIFLTWPFFSSYIWTFIFITMLTFLVGLGILKIKDLIFRK